MAIDRIDAGMGIPSGTSAKRVTLSELLVKQTGLVSDIQVSIGMERNLPTEKQSELPKINTLESMFDTVNKNNDELDRIKRALDVI